MNGDTWISILLLGGAALETLCSIGLWAGRNPYARLHFLGPASFLGPLLIAAAVWVEASIFSQPGVKVLLIFLFMAATGPVISHATAHAVYFREGRTGTGEGEKE